LYLFVRAKQRILKIRREMELLKFDNEFNEIKIRHAVIIYLIDMLILIQISIFMLTKSDGEISSTNMNILCLLSVIFVLFMLISELNPSKEKIKHLYNDFKDKFNAKETAYTIIFLTCLNLGGENIIIDTIYLISPCLANDFIKQSPLTINSIRDYLICLSISVVLSPVVDELTFRNVLFKRLSKKFNVYVGLIVSSVIFSAFNICPEIMGALALGITNCILYVKYENILMPIFIYAASSFINMVVIIPFSGFDYKPVMMTFNYIIINLISGVVLFAIGSIFFVKFIIKNNAYLEEKFNSKGLSV
jgi:membrane protease YdiL (CAAX protease family)